MKKTLLALFISAFALSAHAQVTTLYGNGTSGYSVSQTPADTVNVEFNMPFGVAYDTKGNLWITDQANNLIVLINAGKYQLREGDVQGGFNDGASVGQFGGVCFFPAGIVVAPGKTSAADQIYFCDAGNNAIRKIDSFVNLGNAQSMHTVAGGGKKNGGLGISGNKDGSGTTALFNNPVGIGYVKDASGGYLVVADQGNNAIRKISLHKSDYGTTSTITTDINGPAGIFVDKNNNIYVASFSSGIVEISNTGAISTIAASSNFEGPTSLVVRGTDMFIADNCHIAYLDMTQSVGADNPSVLAGDPADTSCNYKDGSDQSALFNGIGSIALSPDSTFLVVADGQNNVIRKVILPKPHVHTSGFAKSNIVRDKFDVYPNPSRGQVYIKNRISGNADLNLFTSTGKQVMHSNVNINAGEPYNMNLENVPAGMYILQISTVSGVYNNKIIIR